MKIRADDLVLHLNDYHFIHLYRNVNAGTIHTSTAPHVVLLDEFRDWNGLAAAAAAAKKADFTFGGIEWTRKGNEIFPSDGGNAVALSGPDIQTLVSFLNDDVGIPAGKRTKDFDKALLRVESMRKAKASKELGFQWPAKLPGGVRTKAGKSGATKSEHFAWGPNGAVEYPHVHLFLDAHGFVTEGRATLVPAHGTSTKRGFPLLNDLTFDRSTALGTDDTALLELEKVMRSVVYGEDFQGGPAKPQEDAPAEPVHENAAHYESFGIAWNVPTAWVAAVFPECGIELHELGDFGPKDLVQMANPPGGKPRFTVPDSAYDKRGNSDY